MLCFIYFKLSFLRTLANIMGQKILLLGRANGTLPVVCILVRMVDYSSFSRYAKSLESLKSTYGVDSFKFDAGEINYITVIPEFRTDLEMQNLGTYTQKYGECAFR